MPAKRRIIRKLRTIRVLDVEDQLWPIVVALLILAGLVAGTIIAKIPLNEPNLFFNGCTYLVTLAITCGLLVWAAVRLEGHALRRTMLLLLLTMLVHWVIAMMLWIGYLPYTRLAERKKAIDETQVARIVFDAQLFQQDANQNLVEPEFQRPIETRSPEAEPQEIIRKTVEKDEAKPDTKPVDLKPQPNVDRVQPIKLPTPQQTAPKASTTLAKMSRQSQKTDLATRATNVPQPSRTQRQAASDLSAANAPANRNSTEPAKTIRSSADSPATLQQQPTPKLAQKQSRRAPTPEASASAPAVKKAAPTPRPLPNAVALDVAPQPVKKAAADAAEPQATQVTRADTSPKVAKQQPNSQPTQNPTAAAHSTAVSKPQSSSPAQPVVARTTQSAPSRSPRASQSVQTAAAAAPAAAAAAATSQQAATTAAAAAERSKPAATQAVAKTQPTDAPSPTAAKPLTRATTQRANRPTAAPSVASTAAPSRATAKAQSPATTASSNAAAAVTPAAAPSSSKTTPTLTPAPQAVARNSTSQSTPRRTSPRASDTPTVTAAAPAAQPATRRSSQPTPSPAAKATAASGGAPAKTQRSAPTAATQVAATNLPSSTSPTRSAAQFQPSKMSASRSMRGVVGAGRSQNMESNFPASRSPAPTASTAASRPTASQQDNPGPALSPSRPANVAKNRAQAVVPSAVLAVTPDAPSPTATGSYNPAQIDASSSAAAVRSNSSAAVGKVTAAAGDSQVDFGVVRTVEKAQAGRAAGGGQPQVTPGSPTEMLARKRPGGSPEASIDATAVAVAPQSPSKASGGSSKTAVEDATPSASKVARADTGGASPSVVKQADDAGPQSISDGTGKPSPQEIGRADSEPVPPALQPGDGTGRPTRKVGGSVAADTRAEQVAAVGNAGNVAGPATSVAPNAATTAARGDSAAPIKKASADAGSGQLQTGPATAVAKATAGRAASDDSPAASGSSAKSPTRTSRNPATGTEALAVTNLPAAAAGKTAGTSSVGAAANNAARAGTSGTVNKVAQGNPQLSTGGALKPSAARIGRATGSQTTPELAGGGATSLPSRSRAPSSAAGTKAEMIAAAGTPGTKGGPGKGNPAATLDTGAAEGVVARPRGVPGAMSKESVAAAAGSPQDAPTLGAIGRGLTQRATNNGAERAPQLADSVGGAMLKLSKRGALPGTAAEAVDAPNLAAAVAPGVEAMMGTTPGAAERADTGTVQVATNAEMGIGGLGQTPAPLPGSLDRRAQENSAVLIPISARINTKKAGAEYISDLRAQYAQPKFQGRKTGKQLGADYFRGQSTTKLGKAIGTGLEFLAKMQRPDGSWSLNHFPTGYENAGAGTIDSDTAATGLALLVYLGAAYDHDSDRYGDVVRRGLEFLIRNQKENGDLYISRDKFSNGSAHLYSHGIASIALCEAYGMTTDVAMLRDPAQKALDFIVSAQHAKRGGWRYVPGVESDTSVSGWQLMALKSGELAGLNVPKKTYGMVKVFLAKAQDKKDSSRFVYNPFAEERRNPNPTMTAVGLLMRLYLGTDPKDPAMIRGAKHLLNNPPAIGTRRRPTRDTYYWYYATQVMAHMGDEHLKEWNEHLKPVLIDTQVTKGKFAGSWSPNLRDDGVVKDAWGKYGGRIYVTAMNLLSLEVRHRLLPLYRDDTVAGDK